ncbi:hypothetical protein BKA62DRAFT_723351 [Auriculariales sp. MPI-PUGE-AT-0066]|nr:hypothetical protein BKA62DRAFT_723351 [Auriculariales sp. MPI-PUGE-AT-0066]
MSNTKCKDPSVTWWNNQDGLNPCEQYAALRKNCDSGYEVPVLNPNTPPDQCLSQNKSCCCNSVAFSLSMLCLQCQQGVGSGRSGDTGIDAGTGAYQQYLNGCPSPTKKALPPLVQTAVCNSGLKLLAYEYDFSWDTGDWFLEYVRQAADLQLAAGTTDPGKCPAQASTPSPSSSGSSSSVATSQGQLPTSPSVGGSNKAAAIGGAVGGVTAILLLIGLVVILLRKRRNGRIRVRFSTKSFVFDVICTDCTTHRYARNMILIRFHSPRRLIANSMSRHITLLHQLPSPVRVLTLPSTARSVPVRSSGLVLWEAAPSQQHPCMRRTRTALLIQARLLAEAAFRLLRPPVNRYLRMIARWRAQTAPARQ